MLSREEIQNDYDYCTERISEQSRTISLAVIAIVWLFLASKEKPILLSMPSEGALLCVGALSLLALIADYFQYLFGYFNSKNLLDKADTSAETQLQYDYGARLYKARSLMFALKQVSSLLSAILLVVMIMLGILGA